TGSSPSPGPPRTAAGTVLAAGVEKNRLAHGVRPVIRMAQPTQGRFDAARNDRHAGEGFAGAVAVGQSGAIGTQPDTAAGGIGIVVTDFLVGGIVVDHRVHAAGAD